MKIGKKRRRTSSKWEKWCDKTMSMVKLNETNGRQLWRVVLKYSQRLGATPNGQKNGTWEKLFEKWIHKSLTNIQHSHFLAELSQPEPDTISSPHFQIFIEKSLFTTPMLQLFFCLSTNFLTYNPPAHLFFFQPHNNFSIWPIVNQIHEIPIIHPLFFTFFLLSLQPLIYHATFGALQKESHLGN